MEDKVYKENDVCKNLGHDWEIYTVSLEPHNHWHDIEQAGYCKRCGEDTHGQYPYSNENLNSN